MRIDRLALENPRTQGPGHRVWYERHNPEHPRRVASLFDRAMRGRAPGTPHSAIIVGAGACTEIPLELLARTHSRVVLVDLDALSMERARNELPSALRPRVRAVVADITGGVSGKLSALLGTQPWSDLAGLGPAAVIAGAADCIARCAVPDPPELAAGLGTFGLVASTMTLTQLFSLPLLDVLDVMAVVAPALVGEQDADPRYQAAARDFRRRVALAHLNLLAALLAPGGTGVIATDVTGHLIAPARGPHARADRETLPVLPRDTVDPRAELAARFRVAGPLERWRWLASTPTADRPGREYDVVGAVFQSRASRDAGQSAT